ncbi:MAG: T9SS type A sorting domain-containing protein [Ignavibacteria bacterium]|nr:T9SS type A sorting domain-containing protein [Ignavibacteria bacterium]
MLKKIFLLKFNIFTIFILLVNESYSQEELLTHEVLIYNRSSNNITISVNIFPVSCVFNGNRVNGYRYDLRAENNFVNLFDYINGRNTFQDIFYLRNIPNDNFLSLNTDQDITTNGTKASVGFGVYKFEIRDSTTSSLIDTFTVEWDWGYPFIDPVYLTRWSADLSINYYDDNENPRIYFDWSGATREYPISYVNNKIVAWDQQYVLITPQPPLDSVRRLRPKEFGNFILDTVNNNTFNVFPQDSRKDCGIENQNFDDNRSGMLTSNLTINKNITTRDTLIDEPTNIVITKKAALKINSNKIFDMITPISSYNNLIVEDTAYLVLYSSAKINVFSPNKITLKNKSNLTMHNNAEIIIKNGGVLCNEGGIIRGPGKITYDSGVHVLCSDIVNDFAVRDSAKIILEDNAVLILPDDYTLHLRGNTTSLIMKPGSKMMFGENSGIVCDSGAKVIANNAVFTSADSTKKWNGISLKHRSQDTIKNCVIKNADFGINIMNKNDDEETEIPYSTEISGCSFINQTSHVLNNGIYAAGSSKLLILNNTISSNILTKGFHHGIYAELCDGGYFIIIGNTISNSGNGMTIFSSSPFVSKNTVNGNQYSESGIFISDSYGKFEYNIINDFYYTYYSLLSSPDLLKNVFNSSYYDNICLSYSSVPNMHPVISGGSTYWISGDNHFTGSPSNAGIFFEDESYPNMAFGYNRFTLTNNDYYINGTNPTGSDTFDVRENYWGTLSPDQYKINIENSEGLLFNPFDDNSSEQRAVNNYTLYDIGFGLYDTVFFQESDDPGIAQELYLEAYQKEHSGEYQEAIEIYKEIISDYPDNTGSSFAVSSLSRLFNCYEKKTSTVSEYGALQNYYLEIFNDTSYSESHRNLSEDFIIKTKVKQNNIEEAISDYNAIYLNNINTSKGMHALINKEILSAGEGDNFTGGTGIENLEWKQTRINGILSALINKRFNILSKINTQPESFVLSQNYPNPFNPVTKITFSIPVSGNISIRVYDITGKEIKTLVNEFRNAGTYDTEFNGSDLSSGVYYYKMETGNFSEIKKMILIK